jgi:ElaB/YqjD/DUF883 family membrane-anchored ribosome-binding protein
MSQRHDPTGNGPAAGEPFTDAQERLHETAEHARERLRGSAERAAGAAEDTTERIRAAARAMETRISDPARLPAFVRDRPLAAVGIAFGAGLLLGLGRDRGDRSWVMRRAVSKVRTAVMSGLSAAVVHEVRSLVDPAWLE